MLVRVALLIIGLIAGFGAAYVWLQLGDDAEQSEGATQERQIAYWVAPMDSNYRRDKPGKSPMGMKLVPVYADSISDGESIVSIKPAHGSEPRS